MLEEEKTKRQKGVTSACSMSDSYSLARFCVCTASWLNLNLPRIILYLSDQTELLQVHDLCLDFSAVHAETHPILGDNTSEDAAPQQKPPPR